MLMRRNSALAEGWFIRQLMVFGLRAGICRNSALAEGWFIRRNTTTWIRQKGSQFCLSRRMVY